MVVHYDLVMVWMARKRTRVMSIRVKGIKTTGRDQRTVTLMQVASKTDIVNRGRVRCYKSFSTMLLKGFRSVVEDNSVMI